MQHGGTRAVTGWKHDRRSRQARGYGSAWEKARDAALTRDMHLCQPCQREGRATPAREVDHVIPKHKGGTNALTNLQSICTDCHNSKTAQEAAEAQGRTHRPMRRVGVDGYPID